MRMIDVSSSFSGERSGLSQSLLSFIPARKQCLLTCSYTVFLNYAGICPNVKRIWTPNWVIFSGGMCYLLLAFFYWTIDVLQKGKYVTWLMVIGMNSIAAYLIAHLFDRFIPDSFRIHLGENFFRFAGAGLEPLMQGIAVLLTYWLILFWMYRRKIFLRI